MVIALGITLTPIGHFVIAGISSMIYKGVIQAGASSKVALDVVAYMSSYTSPIKILVAFLIIFVQSVVMIFLIIKQKIKCPKWMIILNPLVFTFLSIPVSILLNGTGFEGIAEAFESLGEGFMYLPVWVHWKNYSLLS